jgi:hypothetical protein
MNAMGFFILHSVKKITVCGAVDISLRFKHRCNY